MGKKKAAREWNTEPLRIELTFSELHKTIPNDPKSLDREIAKCMRSGKPFKIYGTIEITDKKEREIGIYFPFSPALTHAIEAGKDVSVILPDGLELTLGMDIIEQNEAKKRKNIKKVDKINEKYNN